MQEEINEEKNARARAAYYKCVSISGKMNHAMSARETLWLKQLDFLIDWIWRLTFISRRSSGNGSTIQHSTARFGEEGRKNGWISGCLQKAVKYCMFEISYKHLKQYESLWQSSTRADVERWWLIYKVKNIAKTTSTR